MQKNITELAIPSNFDTLKALKDIMFSVFNGRLVVYQIIKNGIICILKIANEMTYNCVNRNAVLFIIDDNDADCCLCLRRTRNVAKLKLSKIMITVMFVNNDTTPVINLITIELLIFDEIN